MARPRPQLALDILDGETERRYNKPVKSKRPRVKSMPLYEYKCSDCETRFDALRSMADADAPIACPKCTSGNTRRAISLFAAIGSEGIIAGAGSSCGSCTPSASCATCGLKSAA